jgi:hypothetical protein
VPLLASVATCLFVFSAAASTPNFVQCNSAAPQTPQTNVKLAYTAAQSRGNLNVVIVGWNDATAQISSLTDSKGNAYQLAVGPTVLTGSFALSQAVYYSKNITAALAGGNIVTINFNKPAIYPDLRILEYSGLDQINPFDASSAATGNSATSSSGSVVTRNAMDLLVGPTSSGKRQSAPEAGSSNA